MVAETPVLRRPIGECELAPGDVVNFPEYPEAGKVGAGGRYFRLADAVNYWDGE